MIKRLLVLGILLSFLAGAIPAASAHDEFRLVGTLTKVGKGTGALLVLSVKFKWNPTDTQEVTATVYVWPTTVITKDGKSISFAELQAGQSVVVDTLRDQYDMSDATLIRIVPPPSPAK